MMTASPLVGANGKKGGDGFVHGLEGMVDAFALEGHYLSVTPNLYLSRGW